MKNKMMNTIKYLLNRVFPYQEPRVPLFFDISNESWGERINRNGNLYHYISTKNTNKF